MMIEDSRIGEGLKNTMRTLQQIEAMRSGHLWNVIAYLAQLVVIILWEADGNDYEDMTEEYRQNEMTDLINGCSERLLELDDYNDEYREGAN